MTSNCSRCVLDMRGASVLHRDLLHSLQEPTKEEFANGSLLRDHYVLHSGTVLVDIQDVEQWDLVRPYDDSIAHTLVIRMLVSKWFYGIKMFRHHRAEWHFQRLPNHGSP